MPATAKATAQGGGSDALAFVFAGLLAALVLLPATPLLDLKRAAGTLAAALLAGTLAARAWRGRAGLAVAAELRQALLWVLAAWLLALLASPARENATQRGLGLGAGLVLAWGLAQAPESWARAALRAWHAAALAVAAGALAALPGRAAASFHNAGYLAAFLVLSWPLSLRWRGWRRGASAALLLLALAATQSRAGLLAAGLQLAWLAARAWREGLRPTARGLLLGGLLAAAVLWLLPAEAWLRPTQRWTLWRDSAALWWRHPVFGWGAGNYPLAISGALSPDLAQVLAANNQFAEDPHSVWLLLLCEGGVVALYAFLAALVLGWRLARGQAWFVLGALGLLVQSSADRFFFQAGVFLPLCVGLGLAARGAEAAPPPRRAQAGLYLLLALGLTWSALQPLWAYRQAVGTLAPAGPLPAADLNALRRQATGGSDPAAWDRLGTALASQSLFSEAEGAFRAALLLEPTAGRYQNLGNCQMMQGQFERAESAFRQAVRLDPASADAQFSLGYALFRQRKLPDAVAALNAALRLQPGHPEASKLKEQILR